jgi:Domain of unknown function (DUF4166)/Saccharopine dehydrogenase NADP binding domain
MDVMSNKRVLVIGGYGVFGGLLVQRLVQDPGIDVIVAGRSRDKAVAFCKLHGGRALELDISGDIEADLRTIAPDLVIDAAGPFQIYGDDPYRIARAAIAIGAHYLDLADDGAFVAGINCLDAAAQAAGVTVLSGCSSVPAVSSAAADRLIQGFDRVDSVETCILPGNRAPRGLSVIRAILDQVGKPLRVWEGGGWRRRHVWSVSERFDPAVDGIPPLGPRRASLIGVPDLILFPGRYKSRTVRFLAGLELRFMHDGLAALSWSVRSRLVSTLIPLAQPLQWIAERLHVFGTDRGAMQVTVRGWMADGSARQHRWTVVAEAGDGPQIPPTPALLLAKKIVSSDGAPSDGARPCLGELDLEEVERGLEPFAITSQTTDTAVAPLFQVALGDQFAHLPEPIHRLHAILDRDIFEGRASVERGTNVLAGLIGWLFGFPRATAAIPVTVEMVRTRTGETWTRTFGTSSFRSHLSLSGAAGAGVIRERFGPFAFTLPLAAKGGQLHYPVASGRFAGLIPVPKMLLPVSEAWEDVDGHDRATFDVALSLPWIGLVVRYKGWLAPSDADPAADSGESCG